MRSVFKSENLKAFVFNNPIVVSLLCLFKGLFNIARTLGLSRSATSSSELESSEEDLLSYSEGVGWAILAVLFLYYSSFQLDIFVIEDMRFWIEFLSILDFQVLMMVFLFDIHEYRYILEEPPNKLLDCYFINFCFCSYGMALSCTSSINMKNSSSHFQIYFASIT